MSIGEGTHLWVTHKNQFLTTKPEGEDQQNIRVNPHLRMIPHRGGCTLSLSGPFRLCHAHVCVEEKLGNELNHTGEVTLSRPT